MKRTSSKKKFNKYFFIIIATLCLVLALSLAILARQYFSVATLPAEDATAAVTGFDISTATRYTTLSVGAQDTSPSDIIFNADGTKMFMLGKTGDNVYEYAISTAYDVSTATYSQSLSVGATAGPTPEGLFFNADGTKLFILDGYKDAVTEFTLSTGFDISTASTFTPFSVATEEIAPINIKFNADGTKMFILGDSGNDVNEYTLSTAYNTLTATYSQNFSVAAQTTSVAGLAFNTDGTKMYLVGWGNGIVYEYNLSTGFDVSTMVYSQNFNASTETTSPRDITFNNDGTKMHILDYTDDNVNEYNLSTGFDVSTAVYSQLFNVSTQEGAPYAFTFNTNGTKMYVTGAFGDDVNEYDLSTGFDVSTAVYSQVFVIGGQESTPVGLTFNGDGTKMYVLGASGQDVNEYTLSTGFDISTASFPQYLSISAQETSPRDISFNTTGTKMYVLGNNSDNVNEYNLSTEFNLSTATYSQNFSVAGYETYPMGLTFNGDGTKMFIMGTTGDDVNEYNLSTGFDVSTAVYSQRSSTTGSGMANVGIIFNADGTRMYILAGSPQREIDEYTLSTGFDISTLNELPQTLSITAQDSWPTSVEFNTDGTKMYMMGHNKDNVNEYNLSTGFDISTAVYSQLFSVATKEDRPYGLAFNTDGTKMYVVGYTNDNVNEYNLSTGFDISTAVYSQLFSVATEEDMPFGLAFNTDGTKMYITGSTGDDVNEYDLSTGFDVSTAVYSQLFSVAAQDTSPMSIIFNTNGTKMFIVGGAGKDVNRYDLSTGFDVSTAVYSQVYSVSSEDASPHDLVFNTNGTKMFILGYSSDMIFEYDLADVGLPTVSTLSPADNDLNIATGDNLVLTFDETVTVGTGNITIKLTSDDSTAEAIDVTSGQVTGTGTNTITVNPSSDLLAGLEYYVQIAATAFDDASSNSYAGISDTTSWSFTTLSSGTSAPAPTPANVQLLSNVSSYCSSDATISLTLHAKNTDEFVIAGDEDFLGIKWQPFIAKTATEGATPSMDIKFSIDHALELQNIYLFARNFNGNKSNIQSIVVNPNDSCTITVITEVEATPEPEANIGAETKAEYRARVEEMLSIVAPGATNTFVQSKTNSTIYYVTDTFTLKHFSNSATYNTHRNTNSLDVTVTIPDDIIAALPHSTQMLPKHGVVLVKIPNSPRVYTIDESYRLHYITSEKQAATLYGKNWSEYIIDISPLTFNLFLRNGSVGEVTDDWSVDMSIMKKRLDL